MLGPGMGPRREDITRSYNEVTPYGTNHENTGFLSLGLGGGLLSAYMKVCL